MSVFVERLPPSRGAVTPSMIGRLFRRIAAVNRRMDAENVTPGTLAVTRKSARWLYFDLWGGATRFMNATGDNDNTTALGREFLGNSVIHATRMESDASADLELIGWSVVAPDARFVFTRLRLLLERFTGVVTELDSVRLPDGLDEVDAYSRMSAPFPIALTEVAEEIRVRVDPGPPDSPAFWNIPNALDGTTRDQVVQAVSVGFHFRRRPV